MTGVLTLLLLLAAEPVSSRKPLDLYWNSTSRLFRRRGDTMVTVNQETGPGEYDQVNIICPRVADDSSGRGRGAEEAERLVIYSVTREEYENCEVVGDQPKIVAVCDKPENFMYFTITFRSFSPTPRQLEFVPGESYYFISPSHQADLQARRGGYCSSHHMKLIFRVAESPDMDQLPANHRDLFYSVPPAFWSRYWRSRAPDDRFLPLGEPSHRRFIPPEGVLGMSRSGGIIAKINRNLSELVLLAFVIVRLNRSL